jgi:hypothetical protein
MEFEIWSVGGGFNKRDGLIINEKLYNPYKFNFRVLNFRTKISPKLGSKSLIWQ